MANIFTSTSANFVLDHPQRRLSSHHVEFRDQPRRLSAHVEFRDLPCQHVDNYLHPGHRHRRSSSHDHQNGPHDRRSSKEVMQYVRPSVRHVDFSHQMRFFALHWKSYMSQIYTLTPTRLSVRPSNFLANCCVYTLLH